MDFGLHAVKTPEWAPTYLCVVAWVDEIRSDLKRLDFIMFAKGCHQSHCDCGFSYAAACACDEERFWFGGSHCTEIDMKEYKLNLCVHRPPFRGTGHQQGMLVSFVFS